VRPRAPRHPLLVGAGVSAAWRRRIHRARRAALEFGDQGQPRADERLAERPLLGSFPQPPLELLERDLGAPSLRSGPCGLDQLFDHAHLVG
jgi:hypothetical protein